MMRYMNAWINTFQSIEENVKISVCNWKLTENKEKFLYPINEIMCIIETIIF